MNNQHILADLKNFAYKCIAAQRYPGDFHTFNPARCSECGNIAFELTIEHHTGSQKSNFRGLIWAQCLSCGAEERIFSFTGKHRQRIRDEKPRCICGNSGFFVAECERIERGDGTLGFFDEGVVVGKCSICDRNRAFVFTD